MNPFIFGTCVTGKDFVDRDKEIKSLKASLLGSQNILIYGNRRVGKTSLIYETIRQIKKIPVADIDLLGVTDVKDFYERYITGLNNLTGNIKKIMKLIANLRPLIRVNSDGSPEFTVDIRGVDTKNSVVNVLKMPLKILSKNQKGIIVIDEFQDIVNIKGGKNILPLMRGIIQHHRNIAYIFSGSRSSILNNVFKKKSGPFYNSTVNIILETIKIDYFYKFIKNRFNTGRRQINNKVIEIIYNKMRGIPNDIQRLCHAIWGITEKGERITEDIVRAGIKIVTDYQRDIFEELYKSCSLYQSKVLKALVKEIPEKILSKKFIERYDLSTPATVSRAIKALVKKNIVRKEKGVYIVDSPFFAYWLIEN